MNDSKASIALERDEQLAVIEKMNQAAKDKDIEFRIISKKGDQLVCDFRLNFQSTCFDIKINI